MSRGTKLTMIMTGYLITSNILLVPDMHSELKSFPVPQPEPFGEQLSDDGQGTSTSGYHCFPSGVKSTDNIHSKMTDGMEKKPTLEIAIHR